MTEAKEALRFSRQQLRQAEAEYLAANAACVEANARLMKAAQARNAAKGPYDTALEAFLREVFDDR